QFQHAGKIIDLLHPQGHAIALVRALAVAHRRQIGDEILLVRGRVTEIEATIKMFDHLIIAVISAVMEIRTVEICVQERWCLEKSTAPDVVLQMIDKGPCRHVAGGAAQRRLIAKWLEKERLATQLGLIRIGWRKPTAWAEPRVAQEINVLDVCHQGI